MPLTDKDCLVTYKILVLGDACVGKSALLRCLTGKGFKESLYPTLAADFVQKTFEVDGALIELQLWDSAGQERFRSVTRWQYRGVVGVAMVYDVTDKDSFSHLSYWISSVNQEIAHTGNKYESVPIVLLGNKCDLAHNRKVSAQDGKKLAEKEMTYGFFETSARTGENVFEAFRKLAYHVTEICDPSLMKSYYPNLIRMPRSLSCDTGPRPQSNSVSKTADTTGNQTHKPEIVKDTKTVKLKRKHSKKKRKCCKV